MSERAPEYATPAAPEITAKPVTLERTAGELLCRAEEHLLFRPEYLGQARGYRLDSIAASNLATAQFIHRGVLALERHELETRRIANALEKLTALLAEGLKS